MSRVTSFHLVTPLCCAAVQETHTVFLHYPHVRDQEVLDLTIPPVWMTRGRSDIGAEKWVTVSYCPHCGTATPEIEPRKTNRKICTYIDGGYYCDTCKERLNCCECAPPEYAWKPIVTKSKVAH